MRVFIGIYFCNRNVEELIRFPDVKAHRQLTYGAKQLIAREVVLVTYVGTVLNVSTIDDGIIIIIINEFHRDASLTKTSVRCKGMFCR